MLKYSSPPNGLFKGNNFMTPNISGYYKIDEGVYAELSTGRGIYNEPIWGVTVRPTDALSKLCYSEKEAIDYITSLMEDDNA